MKPFLREYHGFQVLGLALLLLPYRSEGWLVPASDLPLQTKGRHIVTSAEPRRLVRLECVNWYGSHMEDMVPNGLNKRPLAEVAGAIVEFGFNCAHGVLPTWGTGDPETDWAAAAERGGRRVLLANPDLLVFVSGLHFAMLLQCATEHPLHQMDIFRGRLVYVAHDYYWYHFGPLYHEMLAEPSRLAPLIAGITCVFALLSFFFPIPARRCSLGVVPWEALLLAMLTSLALALLSVIFAYRRSCAVREHIIRDVALLLLRLLAGPILLFWARQLTLCFTSGRPQCRLCAGAKVKLLESSSGDRQPTNEAPSIEDGVAHSIEDGTPASAERRANDEGDSEAKVLRPRRHVETVMCCRHWVGAFVTSWQLSLIMSAVGTVFVLQHERAAYLDYEFYESEWDRRWGFLLEGSGTTEAPVWLNEFGTDAETTWWRYVNRYIREHDVDFAYWALNGEKKAGSWVEHYGLFKSDSRTVRHTWKLDALQRLLNTSSPN